MLFILVEAFPQLVLELLVDLGWRSASHHQNAHWRRHPVLTGAGLFIAGLGVGFAFALVLPVRLITTGARVPGASLLLSPLFAGTVMEYYGRWLERRGKERSFVSTFSGGLLFAFGTALARFFVVK